MGKAEKKKEKLRQRLERLEEDLRSSLHKKAAGPAIDVASSAREIAKLRADLLALK